MQEVRRGFSLKSNSGYLAVNRDFGGYLFKIVESILDAKVWDKKEEAEQYMSMFTLNWKILVVIIAAEELEA